MFIELLLLFYMIFKSNIFSTIMTHESIIAKDHKLMMVYLRLSNNLLFDNMSIFLINLLSY